MKIIKFIPILLVLTLYNTNVIGEEKKMNCDEIKSDSALGMWKKYRCKKGKSGKLFNFSNPLKKLKKS